jgi:hypothetical protein
MKYSLFILFFLLSGCIEFDKDSKSDSTVVLSNFRSASAIYLRVDGSEWLPISDNSDRYVFSPESETYEVSIECPFNTYLNKDNETLEQRRLYLLDRKNFPELDLGCDGKLSQDLTTTANTTVKSLSIPYNLSLLSPVLFDSFLSPENSLDILYANKSLFDTDENIEIMGVICQKSLICELYYRQELSYTEQWFMDINIEDKNYLYNMPLHSLSKNYPDYKTLNYITSDRKVFPLHGAFKHFGIPNELRNGNDGFLIFGQGSQDGNFLFDIFVPIYYIYWTTKEWWLHDAPDITIPNWVADTTSTYDVDLDITIGLSFKPLINNELENKYYLASIKGQEIFVSNLYAIKNNHQVNISPIFYQPSLGEIIEQDFFKGPHISLAVHAEAKSFKAGPANLKPQVIIEDSTGYPMSTDSTVP